MTLRVECSCDCGEHRTFRGTHREPFWRLTNWRADRWLNRHESRCERAQITGVET